MASPLRAVFENSSKIVIVMEYASKGDLYDYISERQRLTEQEARHFFRQVVSAVYYCHKVGWHHTPHCLSGRESRGIGSCVPGRAGSGRQQQPGLGTDPVPHGEAQPGLGGEGAHGCWPFLGEGLILALI